MNDEICLYRMNCEVVHRVEGACHPRTCPEAKIFSGKQCPDPVGGKRTPIHKGVFRDSERRLAKKRNRL